MDFRLAPQWDYDVPVIYEVVASVKDANYVQVVVLGVGVVRVE